MNLDKRYESLSLKYRAAVLEREIHQDAMSVSVREFIQAISNLLDELDDDEKQKYKNIVNPSPNEKEIESNQQEDSEKQTQDSTESIEREEEAPNSEKQEPKDEESTPAPDEPEPTLDPRYKEIYRKLALQLHPDKLINKSKRERVEKTEMFKEIQSALSSGDYSALLRVASILGVSLEDVSESDVEFLKSLIDAEEAKIEQMRTSWAWNWYHENSTSKKDQIMLEYIKQNLKK